VEGEDVPAKPAAPTPTAPGKSAPTPAARTATTTTNVSPNVAATTQVDAGAEAAPAFKAFVANAKVSGVFQGSPSRAVINGRLTRLGEVVDPGLGIVFESVDSERRHLVFKDRSGATVSRRF
jgi:hypothetical protein